MCVCVCVCLSLSQSASASFHSNTNQDHKIKNNLQSASLRKDVPRTSSPVLLRKILGLKAPCPYFVFHPLNNCMQTHNRYSLQLRRDREMTDYTAAANTLNALTETGPMSGVGCERYIGLYMHIILVTIISCAS